MRPLSDGSLAAAFFNLGEQTARAELHLPGVWSVRDLWAREELPTVFGALSFSLEPHCCRVVKLRQQSA